MFSPTYRPKVDPRRLTNIVVLLSLAVEFSEAIPGIPEFKLRIGIWIRQPAPMGSWTGGFR